MPCAQSESTAACSIALSRVFLLPASFLFDEETLVRKFLNLKSLSIVILCPISL